MDILPVLVFDESSGSSSRTKRPQHGSTLGWIAETNITSDTTSDDVHKEEIGLLSGESPITKRGIRSKPMHTGSPGQRIEVTQHVVHTETPDHLSHSSETVLCQVFQMSSYCATRHPDIEVLETWVCDWSCDLKMAQAQHDTRLRDGRCPVCRETHRT